MDKKTRLAAGGAKSVDKMCFYSRVAGKACREKYYAGVNQGEIIDLGSFKVLKKNLSFYDVFIKACFVWFFCSNLMFKFYLNRRDLNISGYFLGRYDF